jgi:hypothetical protein
MVPRTIRMKAVNESGRPFSLNIPFIIPGFFLFILFLVLVPILLISAIFCWMLGYGKIMLLSIPMIFVVFWNLSGLSIDVGNGKNRVFFEFI